MTYVSQKELDFENALIDKLVNDKKIKRQNIRQMDDLKDNLRLQINRLNKNKLNGKCLTDREFNRIMTHLEGSGVYESAKKLREQYDLERDDGEIVYLNFVDFNDYSNNEFEVTNQFSLVSEKTERTNRYDVTILLNGLPVIQIELKKPGVSLKTAYDQIKRYARNSYSGLFKYIQIFIISDKFNTRYFANSDRLAAGSGSFQYAFTWTDSDNRAKNNLNDFVDDFFDHRFMLDLLGEFMIINDTDKTLMVMRPYQIYAAKALIKLATETANNGYVWHSTGSGKTLTSFKTAQILSKKPGIKKVIFLVDRKDLDFQTVSEFNKFTSSGEAVNSTDSTRVLVSQLNDDANNFIVTTIQKMDNFIRSAESNKRYKKVLDKIQDEKIVFIVDECHRSNFGKMNIAIRKAFTNNQMFGFTGTPIFNENAAAHNMTTKDVFGRCVHNYLLKDAIEDKNVLPFFVEYYSVISGLKELKKNKDADITEIFESDEYVEGVTNHILMNFDTKTVHKKYNAMLTVSSVKALIKYYNMFKKFNNELIISAIFTPNDREFDNEQGSSYASELEIIMDDYNDTFGTKFEVETYDAYKRDLMNRFKKKTINLMIVVDQMITGFDSQETNTLFVDREMRFHTLLQAYSRTNRVFDANKITGNIVSYRDLKENTDEAILLFNDNHPIETVIRKPYKYYLKQMETQVANLREVAATPDAVDLLRGDEAKKEYVLAFKEVAQTMAALETFLEFDYEDIDIDPYTFDGYKSKYLLIYEKKKKDPKESVLDEVDFNIELMQTDRINFDYIMNLIRDLNKYNPIERTLEIQNVLKELERTDNEELRSKIDIVKGFIEDILPDLTEEDSVDDSYARYQNEKREEEIMIVAEELDVEKYIIDDVILEYEFTNNISRKDLKEKLKLGYVQSNKVTEEIIEFVQRNVERFN